VERLILVALAGFAASLVDGSLGMGFGPTSSTILLAAGVAPAAATFTVNLAKVASGAAGGYAHWKFGNVRHEILLRLVLPGCAGGLLGVALLSIIDKDQIRPVLSGLLCLVALRIIVRFVVATLRPAPVSIESEGEDPNHGGTGGAKSAKAEISGRGLRAIAGAALVGGVTNGLIGAWGPVVTPVVMHTDGVEPREAIGTVNIAEIAVAALTSVALILSRGFSEVDPRLLVALLLGGVVAAPIAAWLVKVLPAMGLGVAVGVLLLMTNVGELVESTGYRWLGWVAWGVSILAALIAVTRMTPIGRSIRHRDRRRTIQASEAGSERPA
jgi:uncharacterized membrane protein YfcA